MTAAEILSDAHDKKRQRRTKAAVDQLRASPDNRATQGALLGGFDEVRNRVTQAFEQMLAGSDPVKELEAAAADATKSIQNYNRTVK